MIARTCNNVQSPDRCKGNSGPWFPRRASWGNCIPLRNAKTGWAFRLKPLAETASRNWRSDWDAISRSSPSGKLSPTLERQNGIRLPRTRVRQCCATKGASPRIGWRRMRMRPVFALAPIEGSLHMFCRNCGSKVEDGTSSAPCAESPSLTNMNPRPNRRAAFNPPRQPRRSQLHRRRRRSSAQRDPS